MKQNTFFWIAKRVRKRIPAILLMTAANIGQALLSVMFALGTRGVIAANNKRWMEAYVHPEQSYIVTHGGVKYRVSKEFTDYVREYEETGRLQSLEIMMGE